MRVFFSATGCRKKPLLARPSPGEYRTADSRQMAVPDAGDTKRGQNRSKWVNNQEHVNKSSIFHNLRSVYKSLAPELRLFW